MSDLKIKTTDLVYAYFDSFSHSNLNYVGRVVDGTVMSIDRKKGIVVVDAGLRAEGVLSIKEFFKKDEEKNLKVGDTVKVYVMDVDGKGGYLLSRENAIKEESCQRFKEAFENDEIIEGIPFAKVKSGISVDFDGFIAFLPGSQIDEGNVTDISDLVGKKQKFKVISFDGKNGVVSRKLVITDSYKEVRDKFFSVAEEGMVVEGKVRNITDYGAFIDLGFGVDALLHVGDISWGKIVHPSEVLSIGEKIKAKVIKVDEETNKIAVSMKLLTENSWLKLVEGLEVGQKIKGKIISVEKYGFFVTVASGVDGLVHLSELAWGEDGNEKIKEYKIGDEVEAIIIEIDGDKQRVGLSIRRLLRNPWKDFAEANKIGDQFDVTITKIVDYGFFVSVGEVEGFVSLDNVAWLCDADVLSIYKVGDVVKVVFISVDSKFTKISFGVKQLIEDPFEKNKDVFVVGKNVTCVVCGLKPDRIEVEVVPGVYSSIRKANLSRDKADQRVDRFTIGDKIDAKITAFNLETKKLILSIKELEEEKYKQIIDKYGFDNTGASIADILGDAFDKFNKEERKKKIEEGKENDDEGKKKKQKKQEKEKNEVIAKDDNKKGEDIIKDEIVKKGKKKKNNAEEE